MPTNMLTEIIKFRDGTSRKTSKTKFLYRSGSPLQFVFLSLQKHQDNFTYLFIYIAVTWNEPWSPI